MTNGKAYFKDNRSVEEVVLKQIQTAPNRRILAAMTPFSVDAGTPDDMVELLRRLDAAEVRNSMSSSRRTG